MLNKIFFLFLLFANLSLFGQSPTEELREYFDDLLLIIHFNHPHYDNIDFLKEIYSPFFNNIAFYGESPHREVHVVKNDHGYYIHKTLRDAMQRWPHYRGYICCQDDCVMNFWNYIRLDKDKIWFQGSSHIDLDQEWHPWPWWNFDCGRKACLEAYKKIPVPYKEQLDRNGAHHSFAFTWADFFYIPAHYADSFIEVSHSFDDPNVFLEIAIPSIVKSLEDDDKIEHLNTFWGGTGQSIDLNRYSTSYDWVHPIKFSKSKNRKFFKKILKERKLR